MRSILAVAACAAMLAACSNADNAPPLTETEIADSKAAPFDLRCTGSKRIDVTGPPELAHLDPPKPFQINLRINLADRAWCQDSCDGIYQIISTDAQTITLASKVLDYGSGTVVYRTIVNRLSGEYRDEARSTIFTLATAKCEKLPFSGFPKAQF